jgi:hypothetical protein
MAVAALAGIETGISIIASRHRALTAYRAAIKRRRKIGVTAAAA